MNRIGWLTIALAVVLLSGSVRAETRIFLEPQVHGIRVDWCKYWATDCGDPAAHLFCIEQGFARALRSSTEQNLGRKGRPTLVLGDGRLCNAPTCSGFRMVTCIRD